MTRIIGKTKRGVREHNSGLKLFLWAYLIIGLYSTIVGFNQARGVGSFYGFSGGRLFALLIVVLVSVITGIGLAKQYGRLGVKEGIEKIVAKNAKFRLLGLVLVGIAYFALLFTRFIGIKIPGVWYFPEPWLFGTLAILGVFFLSYGKKVSPTLALLVSFSLVSLGFVLYRFLPGFSNYPFSYDWSESSRFYDASLFFSKWVYGTKQALPVLDPSRALLQSFPYLISSLPIWVHRLWRDLLWIGMAFSAGHFLVKRLKLDNKWLKFGLMTWFIVYTFLCPVYFHLMVIPLIVYAGFDKKHLWRSALIVVLGSIWAGISRVNWFPAAGILAGILYVLEMPRGEKTFWAYWRWPIAFVFGGLGVAFGAQAIYVLLSGNPPVAFTTSFNSPLYFYRLLPNEVYGIGVAAQMLIASLPLFAVTLISLRKNLKRWWALRHLALLSILLVLMAAGLTVSTKIGGGNNLHNLDLFLVSLLTITIYIVVNKYQMDQLEGNVETKFSLPALAFSAMIPFFVLLAGVVPAHPLNDERANAEIVALQALIDQPGGEGGEVLFIQNRHLLSQGLIQNVELVPEYDKVYLMEMVISNDTAYMAQFQKDLADHRFRIIVMEPIYPKKLTTSSHVFTEEHNAWTEMVSLPVLADYQIVLDYSEDGMIVLVPND